MKPLDELAADVFVSAEILGLGMAAKLAEDTANLLEERGDKYGAAVLRFFADSLRQSEPLLFKDFVERKAGAN